jgi:hypothetical protein
LVITLSSSLPWWTTAELWCRTGMHASSATVDNHVIPQVAHQRGSRFPDPATDHALAPQEVQYAGGVAPRLLPGNHFLAPEFQRVSLRQILQRRQVRVIPGRQLLPQRPPGAADTFVHRAAKLSGNGQYQRDLEIAGGVFGVVRRVQVPRTDVGAVQVEHVIGPHRQRLQRKREPLAEGQVALQPGA